MARFDPGSGANFFVPGFKLTYRPGDPYEFWITVSFEGRELDMTGLSMGDMVGINRSIAHVISEARKAQRHVERGGGL